MLSMIGDLLVMMSLPVFLFDRTGSIEHSSYFTIIVFCSILIMSKISARIISNYHPLKVTYITDFIAIILVLSLYVTLKTFSFDINIFLFICGLIALIINIPMYSKQYLNYKYFVKREDYVKFSLIQGRLGSLVFVFSFVIVAFLYDKFSFETILLIDAITYIPIVLFFATQRNSKVVSKALEDSNEDGSNANICKDSNSDQKNIFKYLLFTYYCVHIFIFIVLHIRSHMLLAIFKFKFSDYSLIYIGALSAVGIALGFISSNFLKKLYNKNLKLSFFAISLPLPFLGLFLDSDLPSYLKIICSTLIVCELLAVGSSFQRVLQDKLQQHFSLEKIVFHSLVFGCVFGVIGFKTFFYLSENFSLTYSFMTLLPFIVIISLRYKNLLKFSILFIGLYNFQNSSFASDYTYKTSMSDRPSLMFSFDNKHMSEDELFITNNISCSLFKNDNDLGLVNDLVKNWKFEGNKILNIQLKKNILDSENNLIDANYIKKAFEQTYINSIKSSKDKIHLNGIKEVIGIDKCTQNKCWPKGLKIIGKYEIEFHLKKALPNFISLLTKDTFAVHIVGKNKYPASCGNYAIKEYNNIKMTLKKRSNKHAKAPHLFEISFNSPDEAYKKFCNQKINDLFFYMPSKAELKKHGCKKEKYSYFEVETAGVWYIRLNNKLSRLPKKIRDYLFHHNNIKNFKEKWNLGKNTTSSIIPRPFGHYPGLEKYKYKSPINKVKYKKTIIIRYIIGMPNPKRLEGATREWMNKTGLKYKIIPTQFSSFMRDLIKKKSDVYIYGELAMNQSLVPYFTGFIEEYLDSNNNINLVKNWNAFKEKETFTLASKLEQIIMRTNLYIPLFTFKRPVVIKNGYIVTNYSDFGLFGLDITNITKNSK